MLPEGTYGAVPISGTMDTVGQDATPLMRVYIQVTHISVDGSWQTMDQSEQRRLDLFTTDKAWPHSERRLRALGFNGDFNEPAFADRSVAMICKHEPGRNDPSKLYERWDLAEFAGGGNIQDAKPPDKDTMRLLERKWKTSESADRKPAGQPAPPPQSPQPEPAEVGRDTDDPDDIPF